MRRELFFCTLFTFLSVSAQAIKIEQKTPERVPLDVQLHVGNWAETSQPEFVLKGTVKPDEPLMLQISDSQVEEIRTYLGSWNKEKIAVKMLISTPDNYSGINENQVYTIDKDTDLTKLNDLKMEIYALDKVDVS